MISAREALERLREGNCRFVSGVRSSAILTSQTRRNELAAGQEPFAIIPRVFRLAGPSRDRLRPRPGRPVRHPRCRQHRRFFSSWQRRVRRGAVPYPAGGGSGALPVRGYPGNPGRTSAADGLPVAEPAFDRRPYSAIRGNVTRDRAQARPGRSGARVRSGQYPRLSEPSATRLGSPRAAGPE